MLIKNEFSGKSFVICSPFTANLNAESNKTLTDIHADAEKISARYSFQQNVIFKFDRQSMSVCLIFTRIFVLFQNRIDGEIKKNDDGYT